MALRARKVSGALERRPPRPGCWKAEQRLPKIKSESAILISHNIKRKTQ